MKCRYALGVSMLLVGCAPQGATGAQGSPGPAGPAGRDAYVMGSRLEARIEGGDDGSRAFAGWYDSKLQTDCRFDRAADGVTRCLPFSRDTINVPVIVYTDQDCTSPVLGFSRLCDNPDGAIPSYIRYLEKSACGGWHVREVADVTPPPMVAYAWTDAGECTAIALASAFFSVGDEIDPAAFVQGGQGIQ